MLAMIGLAVVFGAIFGGYLLAGGKMTIILKALPFEMIMIGGSGIGALLIANSMDIVKRTLGDFGKVLGGPKWKAADYTDLLCLLFALSRTLKQKGIMAIEAHAEKPAESNIFQRYPKILKDHFAIDFICDTLRMMTMNLDDPHQVEDAMEKQMEKHHHEAMQTTGALQTLADGMPALGIVAAVLGTIKTMSAIIEPPEILGKMIGGALTGTFLGVFLAYGMVGPFANRMKQVIEEDHQFYLIIRASLVAYLHGNAPQIVVEIARGNVPSTVQPSFFKLDEALAALPPEAFG
ncbi:MAG: flagellar motor stator protein MotA [Alphaproteobacteria bacterium]|nr:flagellar motor stator protein MotA [Alphaproteobacteria bacterium]